MDSNACMVYQCWLPKVKPYFAVCKKCGFLGFPLSKHGFVIKAPDVFSKKCPECGDEMEITPVISRSQKKENN